MILQEVEDSGVSGFGEGDRDFSIHTYGRTILLDNYTVIYVRFICCCRIAIWNPMMRERHSLLM